MQQEQPAAAAAVKKGAGQRRYVTVLFSDVSGSSEHAERLEAEDYAELLEQFRLLARRIVPQHGGSIARLQGDGLLALFGHLAPSEDDGRRATEAALALHAAVSRLQVGRGAHATAMQLHSGVHAGLVLLIEGDIERGRYDVVGEVPNTAARLCSLADSGQILVSEESLGPRAHFFSTTEMRGLAVRGRATPLNVLRIEGRVALERRIDAAARRGVIGFVGRQDLLATLTRALGQAVQGLAATVVISGEAGIGKTRCIDEFLARVEGDGLRVLRGYCENYLGAEPLQPFRQWLRGALGWQAGASTAHNEAAMQTALAALGAADAPQLAAQVQLLLGGRQAGGDKPQAMRPLVVVDLVERLARHQPLVLVLDDWQWADEPSRQVLEALRAKRLRLLFVVATRPVADEDPALVGAQTVAMQPLGEGETADTIAAWLPHVDPFVAQEIVRQAGGSPLFIEELCHAAAAGRELRAAPHSPGVAWINALVASRVAQLPPAQAECLRVAAVAGNTVEIGLLQGLLGDAAVASLLGALAELDFLVPAQQPGVLRFKHVITRDAVYATVPLDERRALHRRVAERLQATVAGQDAFEWLEALSYHFDAAALSSPAARYAEAAGDKALAAMALDRARAQYTTALRGLDALTELTPADLLRWCAIAQKLGQTCVFDALGVNDSMPLFRRAADLARRAGDQNAIARAEYWLGYVNYGRGQPRRSVQHCESALQHAVASADARLEAQVRATLGQALASAGRYDRALPLLTQAYESKRLQARPGSGTAIGSAYTLARLAYTLGDLGRFDEAHGWFAESLRLLGDEMHAVKASVLELQCAVHIWQGRWAEAEAAGLQGADMALRCRSRFNTVMGRALAACATWAASGDAAALQTLREATAWIDSHGGAVSTSLNYGWLVEATVSLGLHDEARQHAARLLLRARAQDRQGEAQGHRALALQASQRGDGRRVSQWLARADRAADFRGSPRERAVNTLARAECALALGQPRQAQDLAGSAAEALLTLQMAVHHQRAQALARAADQVAAGA